MHRKEVRLAVDQRALSAQGARVAEQRNVELLGGFVEGVERRVLHLLVQRIAHQMGGLAAERLDAMAQLVGHLLCVAELFPDGGIGGPAAHREIVGRDHDGLFIDLGAPHQQVRRSEALERAVWGVARLAGDAAHLAK